MEYITKSGDTWDKIAYEKLGAEKHMGLLIQENPSYIHYVVFPSGIRLVLPDVPAEESDDTSWKEEIGEIDDEQDLEEFEEEGE